MIPERLPEGVRVAHKTGEISTACHDAGIVYPPERAPFLLAILTEHGADVVKRTRAVADLSLVAYRFVVGAPEKHTHE